MDATLVNLYLNRYGFDVPALLQKTGINPDKDDVKLMKLIRHLADRAESLRYGNYNVSKSSKLIGTYLGPSLILGEVDRSTLAVSNVPRTFELLCSCGNTFVLPILKLTSHRRCPECTGWDQSLTGEYAATGRKLHKPPKSTGVRKYALVYVSIDQSDKRKCIVRCDCGKTKSVYRSAFSAGTIKSCGCGIHKSLESQP